MKKQKTEKAEKIPSKRDRVTKKFDDAIKVPKLPKKKKTGGTLVEILGSDEPKKRGRKKAQASDADTQHAVVAHDMEEANKRCVKTARKLIASEAELKAERKRCRAIVESCEVVLKEAIEMPCDGNAELDAWRKSVVVAWQENEEAIAGMGAVCDPIAADVKALKNALREQISNIDQLGLRF